MTTISMEHFVWTIVPPFLAHQKIVKRFASMPQITVMEKLTLKQKMKQPEEFLSVPKMRLCYIQMNCTVHFVYMLHLWFPMF